MSVPLSNRIEHLFEEALQRTTRLRRSEFLKESCGEDSVRSRLEALLSAHEEAGDFLETPILDLDSWSFVLRDEFSRHPGGGPLGAVGSLSFLDDPDEADDLGSFAGYGVTQLLGRGGAGIVLQARDRRLNRVVALKVLAPEWAAQPQARQRFLREARAAAAVRHEHVVAIHAIDETASLPFLVMEYVPGESLQQRISRDGPLEIREVLRIGREAASGLAAAHAERLVHRDVKPANILLEGGTGRVRITDFGLARTVDDVGITQEGMIAGTPQYMSPEQAKGNPIDLQSDLFSLGSVLYAMCAGRPPFRAENNLAVMRKICDEQPQPLREVRPETPLELATLIDELLAKDPANRPQTAAAIAARLAGISAEDSSVRPSESIAKSHSRRRMLIWGSAGAVALAAAVAAFEPWNSREADDSGSADSGPQPPVGKSEPKVDRPLNAALFDPSVKPLTEFRRMTVRGKRIDSLAVSPDGTRVYAGSSDGVIYVWDTRTGKEAQRYPGHRPVTNRILISRDGKRMATFGADRIMRIWNTETGSESLHVPMGIPFRGAALSPDGSEVAVTFVGGRVGAGLLKRMQRPAAGPEVRTPVPVYDKISIFTTVTGRRRRFLAAPQTDSFHSVDWSSDGRHIAAGTDDGRVLLFDAKTGAVLQDRLASVEKGPAYGIRFSRDGKRLFAAGSGNYLWCWEVPGGGVAYRRRFQQGIVRFAVSDDGRWLAFGGRPEIRLLSLHDQGGGGSDALFNLDGHMSAVHSVAFVPKSDVLVSYGRDGTVRMWRLPSAADTVRKAAGPAVRRLHGIDGFASDANDDGNFESIDTRGPDLYVTRPTGTGTFPREVAVMEFDARSFESAKLQKAILEVQVTLTQTSNTDPTFDLEIHAYAADGKLTAADGGAPGELATRLSGGSAALQGTLRIPLNVSAIRRLMAQSGRVGLRVSNTRGNRLRFASSRYYVKESGPVLELHFRP